MAQERNEQREERLATVMSWVKSPVGAAGGLTAAGVAVATLPFLKHTRHGIREGLHADSADIIPGSDASRDNLLRGSGFVLGCATGTQVSWQLIQAASANGTFHASVRVPVAIVGGMASAFLGMEMAEPMAALGGRVSRSMWLGAGGLQLDAQSALGYDIAPPSSSHGSSSPSSSSSSEGSGRGWFGRRKSRASASSESPRGDNASRGGGGGGWGWGWGLGGGSGPSTSSATSSATSASRERDAAGRVDATSLDALRRELIRLRHLENTEEVQRVATWRRWFDPGSRLGDIRAAKADIKTRCKKEHGLSLGEDPHVVFRVP